MHVMQMLVLTLCYFEASYINELDLGVVGQLGATYPNQKVHYRDW